MNTCLHHYLKISTWSPEIGQSLCPAFIFISWKDLIFPKFCIAAQHIKARHNKWLWQQYECVTDMPLNCYLIISYFQNKNRLVTNHKISRRYLNHSGKKGIILRTATFKCSFIKFSIWILFPLVKTFYPLMLENSLSWDSFQIKFRREAGIVCSRHICAIKRVHALITKSQLNYLPSIKLKKKMWTLFQKVYPANRRERM